MSATEFHVVIACPPYWAKASADALAERLLAAELPDSVGVYVWTLTDGKITDQAILRTQEDAEGYRV